MSLGLDENGLHTQTQEEIVDELTAKIRALPQFGPNTKNDPKSFVGGIIHMVAETRAMDQEVLRAVYNSMDPNGARGRALDARCALTGSTRRGALPSSVTGILTFSAAGTAAQGMLIKNTSNNTLWKLTDGPHTVAMAGTAPAEFTCITNGPVLANAGTTWSIVTTTPNLTSFTNPADDANPGRDRAQDPDFRKQRLTELYSQGQGPLATIKARVSKVAGVVSVRVYHNQSVFPVDSNGIPFKAFNVVVETSPVTPGADLQQAIHDAVWLATGAGGYPYGTSYTGNVIDSEGQNQPSAFDVIVEVPITIEIDLVTSTSEDPITPNIEAVVAARVLAEAQAEHELPGRDVRALDYQGIVRAMLVSGEISGVDAANVRLCKTATPPALAVAKVPISIRQRADFNSVAITVTKV